MIGSISSITRTSASFPAHGRGRSDATSADATTDTTAGPAVEPDGSAEAADETNKKKQDAEAARRKPRAGELTPSQQRAVEVLKNRDAEVRAHEAAHQAVGGDLAGSANFGFATGPDGKRYAVSGEVSIDVSPVPDNPSATITKMMRVQAAALAPADPSGQDLAVAAMAAEIAAQAQMQLLKQRSESSQEDQKPGDAQKHKATSGYAQASATSASQPLGSALDVSA